MPLVTSKTWLRRAQTEGWAVGAFNVNTMEQAQAIVGAAKIEGAPVILQCSHRALLYLGQGSSLVGLRYMAHIGRVAAEAVDIPVILHLDHGTYAEVLQATALGFTSAMFDGGDLPLDENIGRTRALCEAVHDAGLTFEAELGEVPRMAGEEKPPVGELTDPEQGAHFVEQTGADVLASAIGSVHAVKEKEVELDLGRLAAIRVRVSVPLVLHGSSGVTDHCIRAGIQGGLTKVNVATQLNQAFTEGVRACLAEQPSMVDPRVYLSAARAAVVERVRERIRFFGAAGKAEG
jgi:fructose-bisphosphate aldolase class II